MGLLSSVQKDSSAKVLILSNVITIVLAVVFSWNLLTIIWVYWIQSVIIGFFNFFRILTFEKPLLQSPNSKEMNSMAKIFFAFFFLFHYGLFHAGYFFFLILITFMAAFRGITAGIADFSFVFLAGVIFFLNHGYSFVKFKDKPKNYGLGTLMFFPYARIFPMHFIVMLMIFTLMSSFFSETSLVPLLVLFLLLKTCADLIMHYIEHREQLGFSG